MDQTLIYVISALLSLLVMVGIALMSKVRYASLGNSLSALAILAGIVFTLLTKENNGTPIITAWSLYPSLIIGTLIGGMFAMRVKMIQMPQLVALLNGLGGGASALVGILSVAGIGEALEATSPLVSDLSRWLVALLLPANCIVFFHKSRRFGLSIRWRRYSRLW